MKYLGIFESIRPIDKGKILYAYVGDYEIIINYDDSAPFKVTHLSIFIERVIYNSLSHNRYQVFEVDYFAQTDEEAKIFARDFAENILRLRNDLYYEFKRNNTTTSK